MIYKCVTLQTGDHGHPLYDEEHTDGVVPSDGSGIVYLWPFAAFILLFLILAALSQRKHKPSKQD